MVGKAGFVHCWVLACNIAVSKYHPKKTKKKKKQKKNLTLKTNHGQRVKRSNQNVKCIKTEANSSSHLMAEERAAALGSQYTISISFSTRIDCGMSSLMTLGKSPHHFSVTPLS